MKLGRKKRRRARWARRRWVRRLFGSDAVGAFSVAALEGFNRRSPLLPECAAQKAADRVGLPSGRLREFLQGDAAGPFQQIDDLGRFAAAAGSDGFLGARGFSGWLALGRRNGGARFGNTRLRRRSRDVFFLFLRNRVGHFVDLSFGGSCRVTTFIALFAHICKRILAGYMAKTSR